MDQLYTCLLKRNAFQKAFFVLVVLFTVNCLRDARAEEVHIDADTDLSRGFWRQKVVWKMRLVKDWKVIKYVVPLWRKVYGPVQIKEWVPYPKAPPSPWDLKHA